MADDKRHRRQDQQEQGSLENWQRYRDGRTCPICGGRTDIEQSDPERCWGYIVSNRRGAYCSREPSEKPHPTYGDHVCWHPLPDAPTNGSGPEGDGASLDDQDYVAHLVSEAEGVGIQSYHYYDRNGNYLRTKFRMPNGSKTWDKRKEHGAPKVPYNIRALVKAAAARESVWVADGERDVEALTRAGAVAVCGPNGMEAWNDDLSEYFRGCSKVTIVQDRDAGAGAKGAAKVRTSLAPIVPEVAIVQAAKGHKDARDHLRAHLKLEDFVQVDGEVSSWTPLDLLPVIQGEEIEAPPAILARTDGLHLVYRSKVHIVYGEPEAGKGWIVLAASAEQLLAGQHVVYVDFETDAVTVVSRLRSLQVPDDVILQRFAYIRPEDPLRVGEAEFHGALEVGPSLVVFDGLTEGLGLEGIDLKENTDVANWIRAVPRHVAYTTGAAALINDHVPHGSDRMIGAQHKKAGIDVAYYVQAVETLGRGTRGVSKIQVTKDRPGHVRPHALDPKKKESDIAELVLEDESPGIVSLQINPVAVEGPAKADPEEVARAKAIKQCTIETLQKHGRMAKGKLYDAAVLLIRAKGLTPFAKKTMLGMFDEYVTSLDNPITCEFVARGESNKSQIFFLKDAPNDENGE
jgi:hypothetical protein